MVKHSYREAEAEWKRRDNLMLSLHGKSYHKMFRHTLMPPALSGRASRMVGRVASLVLRLSNVEQHGPSAPEWSGDGAAFTRSGLALALRTMRKYILHLNGYTHEFSPILRKYITGAIDDVDFRKRIEWALRFLEKEAWREIA